MKKIITAAAIAAMAASFATAEVKVSLNYRTGIQALEHELGHHTTVFNNVTDSRTTEDSLSLKGSAEYGGVEAEITLHGDGSSKMNAQWTDSNKTKILGLKKYNGWINFGNFMLKSGAWESRAVGRVNADIGNHETKYWGEINKPGLAVNGGTAGNGKDVGNLSNNTQSTMVQYNNKDLGLEVRVGYKDIDGTTTTFAGKEDTYTANKDNYLLQGNKNTVTYAYDDYGNIDWKKTTIKTATDTRHHDWISANDLWFGEVGYRIDGVGRILATTKLAHKDYTGALFFEPKLDSLANLTSLVGFTYETATDVARGKGLNSELSESANTMGIDLRARYNLSDVVEGLSVTFMYNWTFGNTATDKVATNAYGTALIKNYKGYYTYYDDAAKPGFYATWAMLNVTYKLNDTFTPFLSLGWSNSNKCGASGMAAKFDDPFTYSLRTYAGVEIYNTKNANLITGICWDAANMNDTVYGGECTKTVSIPVLLRVKF